jgi:hypothetical protein
VSAHALNWNDPAACAAWLADVAARCKDAVAVAEDQTRPLDKRRLGRVTARRLLAEAKGALQAQLRYARRGLAAPGEAWIRVTVAPGPVASERSVSFPAGDRNVVAVVDERDVERDLLRVTVLEEHDDRVTVRLPRELVVGGFAVTLPAGDVFRGGG